MRKLFSKKLLSVLLASSMVIGSASALTGCGSKKNEVIKLNVYSQLANSQALQRDLRRGDGAAECSGLCGPRVRPAGRR